MYPLSLFCTVLCRSRDAADLVVQGKGKFEELMVCSHEIAASTAQLVAASKVSKEYIVFTPPEDSLCGQERAFREYVHTGVFY